MRTVVVDIDAVAHVDPRRLKEAAEQMEAEYSEVLSYFFSISRYVVLKFSSIGVSNHAMERQVSVQYELKEVQIEAPEIQQYLDRLMWTRLNVSDRQISRGAHLKRTFVRHVRFVQVGSLLVSAANCELLTPEATITEYTAGTNVPLQSLGKSVGLASIYQFAQQHVQSEHLFRKANDALALPGLKAYLAPVVLTAASRVRQMNWNHVLASLARYPGALALRCHEVGTKEVDRAYSLKAVEAIRMTYAGVLPEESIASLIRAHLATLSPQLQYAVQIEFSSANELSLSSAIQRDLDPERLMITVSQDETDGRIVVDPSSASNLSRLKQMWPREHLTLLLSPPYTMRHALPKLPHFRPHPFRIVENERSPAPKLELGTVYGRTPLTLALQNLCRHILVTGGSGSGKTLTIKKIIGEVLRADPTVSVLTIDPAKREYRDLLSLYGFRLIDLASAGFHFNPFICGRKVRVYDHCDNVAEALTLLFPASQTSASFILQMVRHAYLNRYQKIHGKYDREALFRLTGEDLFEDSKLVPTFREFMELGLPYLRWLNQQSKSEWMGEFLSYFTTRTERMRVSVFYHLTNPLLDDGKPDRLRSIDSIFEGKCLLETGRLSEAEGNSVIAFILGAFRSKVMSENLGEDHLLHVPAPLRHVITLDEAHRVLPPLTTDRPGNVSDPGEAVSKKLSTAIAELRSAGVGVVLGEQSPSKISDSALINTASKFIHRTTNGKDRQTLAAALGLRDDEAESLASLTGRQAIVISPELYEPVLAEIDVPQGFVSFEQFPGQRRVDEPLSLSVILIGSFEAIPEGLVSWELKKLQQELAKVGNWTIELVVGSTIQQLDEGFGEGLEVVAGLLDAQSVALTDLARMAERFDVGKMVAVIAGEKSSGESRTAKELERLVQSAKGITSLLTFDPDFVEGKEGCFDNVVDGGKLVPTNLARAFEQLTRSLADRSNNIIL